MTVVGALSCWGQEIKVGPRGDGAFVVPTAQLIRPPGKSLVYVGRPVDLALSSDGKTVYVKSNKSLLAIDAANWTISQELKYPEHSGGASMHGIIVSPDGKKLFVSLQSYIIAGNIASDGTVTWAKRTPIFGTAEKRDSYPCGMTMLPGDRLLVSLSMNNALAIVNLMSGRVEREIAVGMAPYAVVVSPDRKTAYVTNWGGRRATANDKTSKSSGDDIVVDDRGTAASGTVSVVDLAAQKEVAQIETGLHPSEMVISADGKALYVANANSDSVSIIDTASRTVTHTVDVHPDAKLPFGSMPNAVTLSSDEKTLFVANGGNNAIAVVDLNGSQPNAEGFIPTGWYPAAVIAHQNELYIANLKGIGSRDPAKAGKWTTHDFQATIQKVEVPDPKTQATYTQQVLSDALVPQVLLAQERTSSSTAPKVAPEKIGDPSLIKHVVYIIKENRTYDQIFGDMPRGNSDPNLCMYGKQVTPNHHALAEQFGLLDNYYCNGVMSADGHAWSMEGVAVDWPEKGYGGWSRSYPFPGDDAMAIAPTGFIWDDVLMHGLSYRNYGEMSVAHPQPVSSWTDVYLQWKNKTNKIELERLMANANLRRYSCENSPGWNLHVPDQMRADAFLKEFAESEKSGQFANLTTLYLPQDHTSGMNVGQPTTSAMIADNDLALGRVVDAITHSKFWPDTCIFVVEDDPQSGFDHVDGHRSLCLVISPYSKHHAVVSNFYNQTSVLHTMELMLGCPFGPVRN